MITSTENPFQISCAFSGAWQDTRNLGLCKILQRSCYVPFSPTTTTPCFESRGQAALRGTCDCLTLYLTLIRTLTVHTAVYLRVRSTRARQRHPELLSAEDKRKMFVKQKFKMEVHPLHAFPHEGETFATMFPDGWGQQVQQLISSSEESKFGEATFAHWSRGEVIQPAPFPTNEDGEQLCHGSILGTSLIDGVAHPDRQQFSERPLELTSALVMRRWLKVRNASPAQFNARRESYFGECACAIVCASL